MIGAGQGCLLQSKRSGLPRTQLTGCQHGLEVGAQAYLPKSTFDQTALLQIIEQLL